MRFFILFILPLLAASPASADDWIHVVDVDGRRVEVKVTESLGDNSTIRAECIIPAPHERVWSVLSDYDHLEDVIPVVSESRVEAVAEDHIVLYQEGRAGLWFIERDFMVRFRVKEVPMAYIGFEAYDGDFKRFVGTWQVDERDGGTWVAHRVEVEPDFFAPGWAVRRVARGLMMQTIDGVIERCVSAEPAASDR